MHAIDDITGSLKLLLNKKSSTEIDAAVMNAKQIGDALSYLIGPIVPSALFRFPVEEVEVVLADEELRVVYRIRQG